MTCTDCTYREDGYLIRRCPACVDAAIRRLSGGEAIERSPVPVECKKCGQLPTICWRGYSFSGDVTCGCPGFVMGMRSCSIEGLVACWNVKQEFSQ